MKSQSVLHHQLRLLLSACRCVDPTTRPRLAQGSLKSVAYAAERESFVKLSCVGIANEADVPYERRGTTRWSRYSDFSLSCWGRRASSTGMRKAPPTTAYTYAGLHL